VLHRLLPEQLRLLFVFIVHEEQLKFNSRSSILIEKEIPMGLFGKKPQGPAQSPEEVRTRLLALNRPTSPFQIVDGQAEGVDLVAEWKIVDAQWYEIFAKVSLTKVFRIYVKLDPEKHELRAQDHEYTVEWRAGVPTLSLAVSSFKGQTSSVEFGAAYAFTETLAPGQVYKYRFNTGELKKPIQEAVEACGWAYKGIAFGKL
jgi:hypothetical protein